MALDDVAVEPIADPERPLDVDLIARPERAEVLFESVSVITSKPKVPGGSCRATVRQAPLTAMLSPCLTSFQSAARTMR